MKKTLLAALLAASAAMVTTPALASDTLWGAAGDAVSKLRNAARTAIPTTVQALEADGGNFRYYEWEAPHNPNVICWAAAGTQKGAGGCYPKANPNMQLHK